MSHARLQNSMLGILRCHTTRHGLSETVSATRLEGFAFVHLGPLGCHKDGLVRPVRSSEKLLGERLLKPNGELLIHQIHSSQGVIHQQSVLLCAGKETCFGESQAAKLLGIRIQLFPAAGLRSIGLCHDRTPSGSQQCR